MSQFHSYMWSVPDWRTDEMYATLDNREQGVYRNLLDECWVSGAIPSDPEILARFVREPLDYFLTVWAKISPRFRRFGRTAQLRNPRMQEDKERLIRSREANNRRTSAATAARMAKRAALRGSIRDVQRNVVPDSDSDKKNTEEGNILSALTPPGVTTDSVVLSTCADALRDADDEVEARHDEREPRRYGEFGWVWLTDVQYGKLEIKLDGDLERYIADFDCWVNEAPDAKTGSGVRRKNRHAYETISAWSSRDRKGANHGRYKSKTDRTIEAAQRLRARLDREDERRSERGAERAHTGGLPGAPPETSR